ncbi:hypothetical protein CALCODRAFT_295186 [Calocera cornea HHB12733]|uniref:Uncharacterized protein n=1 Tax=Calocera cornea HHB12733 TaxID=1353952 RepID=A0A165FNV0_9BASI|nr:hypothetical protein CALCODRAFT_295186 [Calocera cornea HHB12733]
MGRRWAESGTVTWSWVRPHVCLRPADLSLRHPRHPSSGSSAGAMVTECRPCRPPEETRGFHCSRHTSHTSPSNLDQRKRLQETSRGGTSPPPLRTAHTGLETRGREAHLPLDPFRLVSHGIHLAGPQGGKGQHVVVSCSTVMFSLQSPPSTAAHFFRRVLSQTLIPLNASVNGRHKEFRAPQTPHGAAFPHLATISAKTLSTEGRNRTGP